MPNMVIAVTNLFRINEPQKKTAKNNSSNDLVCLFGREILHMINCNKKLRPKSKEP